MMPNTKHKQGCSQWQQKEVAYQYMSQRLSTKFPNLRNGDNGRQSQSFDHGGRRLLCYDFDSTGITATQVFLGPDDLRQYLDTSHSGVSVEPRRRLFILEGIDDTYKTILGAHLKVHPLFWLRHSKTAAWETNSEKDGNVAPLASLTNPERSSHLLYCQLVRMNIDEQNMSMCCAEDERHISSSRVDGKFDGVGTIHRKVSFWSQKAPNGGWEALLVVDRPLRRLLGGSNNEWKLIEPKTPPTLFQGGYADFIDYDDIEQASETVGPPRTSMFDDLKYYFENHFGNLQISSNPRSAIVFVEKIVASEYMLLIQYHQNLLCHLQWRLSRNDHFGQFKIDWIEQTWSDLMAFQRRLDNRRISVQEIVRHLEWIKPDGTDGLPTQSQHHQHNWRETKEDFMFIESQLSNLLRKTETLVAAFTALSGATAAQQSLTEARVVRSLSFVGMVFLPLSLVAALFSMSDDYQPGGPRFWVYFAVCVPLVMILNGLALLQMSASRIMDRFQRFKARRGRQLKDRERGDSVSSNWSHFTVDVEQVEFTSKTA